MGDLDVNTNVNQLPSWAVDLMMEELEIAGFLKDPQCDFSSYSTTSKGWDNTGNTPFTNEVINYVFTST